MSDEALDEFDKFVPFADNGECDMCGVPAPVWVDMHPELGAMGFCKECSPK